MTTRPGFLGNKSEVEKEAGPVTARMIRLLEKRLADNSFETIQVRNQALAAASTSASISVRDDSGTPDVGNRPRLNFIESTGINQSVTDSPGNNEIQITTAVDTAYSFAWTAPHTITSTTDPQIKWAYNSTDYIQFEAGQRIFTDYDRGGTDLDLLGSWTFYNQYSGPYDYSGAPPTNNPNDGFIFERKYGSTSYGSRIVAFKNSSTLKAAVACSGSIKSTGSIDIYSNDLSNAEYFTVSIPALATGPVSMSTVGIVSNNFIRPTIPIKTSLSGTGSNGSTTTPHFCTTVVSGGNTYQGTIYGSSADLYIEPVDLGSGAISTVVLRGGLAHNFQVCTGINAPPGTTTFSLRDDVVIIAQIAAGPVTLNLPDISNAHAGHYYRIKRSFLTTDPGATYTVTIVPYGTDTIQQTNGSFGSSLVLTNIGIQAVEIFRDDSVSSGKWYRM